MQAFIKHRSYTQMNLAQMGLDKYKINKSKPQTQDKPKRVRRTKAELIAAGYYDKDKSKPKVEVKEKNKDKDRTHLFTSNGKSIDQFSTQAIQKAKERGEENWEQDFRNDYEKGQKIYYVEINELCHTKEVLELYVGTVYSKVMICWVDRGEAHSIGIEDADKIFTDEKAAKKYYAKVRIK